MLRALQVMWLEFVTVRQVIPPEVWADPAMRRALAHRDIGAVYRLLTKAGVSQRRIAELVGQSQSEVCEILKGRQVMGYDVLVRIAGGLGVERGWMGLAHDGVTEPTDPVVEEVSEAMKRRALVAFGSGALFGSLVPGAALELPFRRDDTPLPLPSRLGITDVAPIRRLTSELRTVARTYGGGADVMTDVANQSRALMSVSASDRVRAELGSALAELHTAAGWCCVDSGLPDHARSNFATAMELAANSGDDYQLVSAFNHAGVQMIEAGAYQDGLEFYQLGRVKLGLIRDDDARGQEALAWLHGDSAIAWAAMGDRDAAVRAISKAREWQQTTAFGDAVMDCLTSSVYRRLGQWDQAEAFAASSVRKFAAEGTARRDGVEAEILLATIHTRVRESDSVALVQRALGGVASLRSTRARTQLAELIGALDARPDSTSHALAHHARRLSA
ncbi:MAG: helix-turn-helix domain-containing protein [Pseudonocardiaceae bacterium]